MSSLKRFSTSLFWSLGIHVALFFTVGISLIDTHTAPSRTMSIELRYISAQKSLASNPAQTTIAKNIITEKVSQKKDTPIVTQTSTHAPVTNNEAISQPDIMLATTIDTNNDSAKTNITTNTVSAPTTLNTQNSAIEMPIFDAAFLKNPQPSYPVFAQKRQQEGTVMLKVQVSTDGKAEVIELAKSSGFGLLDEAAQQAVAKWQFIPARQGDLVVIASVIVPIRFALR